MQPGSISAHTYSVKTFPWLCRYNRRHKCCSLQTAQVELAVDMSVNLEGMGELFAAVVNAALSANMTINATSGMPAVTLQVCVVAVSIMGVCIVCICMFVCRVVDVCHPL